MHADDGFGSILPLVQFGIFFCFVYDILYIVIIHCHTPEQREIYTKLDHGQG